MIQPKTPAGHVRAFATALRRDPEPRVRALAARILATPHAQRRELAVRAQRSRYTSISAIGGTLEELLDGKPYGPQPCAVRHASRYGIQRITPDNDSPGADRAPTGILREINDYRLRIGFTYTQMSARYGLTATHWGTLLNGEQPIECATEPTRVVLRTVCGEAGITIPPDQLRPPLDPVAFGQAIRSARDTISLNQINACRRLRMSTRTLTRLERGQMNPEMVREHTINLFREVFAEAGMDIDAVPTLPPGGYEHEN